MSNNATSRKSASVESPASSRFERVVDSLLISKRRRRRYSLASAQQKAALKSVDNTQLLRPPSPPATVQQRQPHISIASAGGPCGLVHCVPSALLSAACVDRRSSVEARGVGSSVQPSRVWVLPTVSAPVPPHVAKAAATNCDNRGEQQQMKTALQDAANGDDATSASYCR